MPRYIVQHDFGSGLNLSLEDEGSKICRVVTGSHNASQVTWLHAYMSLDKKKSFCIYDAPSPEAIQRVASMNGLPIQQITEVMVPDPNFYC